MYSVFIEDENKIRKEREREKGHILDSFTRMNIHK